MPGYPWVSYIEILRHENWLPKEPLRGPTCEELRSDLQRLEARLQRLETTSNGCNGLAVEATSPDVAGDGGNMIREVSKELEDHVELKVKETISMGETHQSSEHVPDEQDGAGKDCNNFVTLP